MNNIRNRHLLSLSGNMDKNLKYVSLALIFVILAVFLAQLYYSGPITADAFERLRVTNSIINNTFPPINPHIGASGYNYPPVFDFSLASLSVLLGISSAISLQLFSFILIFMLIFSVFFLASKIGNEKIAFFATIFLVSVPWLFYRMVTPISESLGLVLFLVVLIAFYKNRFASFGFFMFVLAFSHFRSFAVVFLVLLVYSFLSKKLFNFVLYSSVPTALFLLFVPRSYLITNPWVEPASLTHIFTLFSIILALAGYFIWLRSKHRSENINFSIFVGTILLIPFVPFEFRQFAYLFFPVVFFSGVVASNIESKKLLVLLILILGYIGFHTIVFRAVPFTNEELSAVAYLKTLPENNVAAPFSDNYLIPYYANKKIVLGSFAEGLGNGNQRARDLWDFFHSFSNSSSFIKKYKINYIFWKKPAPYSINCTKMFDSDSFSIYAAG